MILLEIDIATDICIPFIVGIFAFALPLILTVTRNIDEKYSSSKIMGTFFKSWQVILFITVLILSILLVIIYGIYALGFKPPCDCFLWNNPALILLFISSIALIFSTILVIYLAYVYYSSEKLLSHFECMKYKRYKNNLQYIYIIMEYNIKNDIEFELKNLKSYVTLNNITDKDIEEISKLRIVAIQKNKKELEQLLLGLLIDAYNKKTNTNYENNNISNIIL
jgi:hypothetical protein